MTLRSVMTVALLLFAAAAARAEWTLVTSDFAEQKGLTVNTWDLHDGLSVTTETGKLMKVETRKVLSLASEKVKAGDATGSSWKLMMRNGDVLFGEPAGISGQSLQFTMPEAGKILVPLKLVAGIRQANAAKDADGAAAEDKDSVRLQSGDRLEGLVVDVNAEKVQISPSASDTATTDVPMNKVLQIGLGGVTPARTIPPLSVRLTFVSGSVLTVPLNEKGRSFSWTINSVEFRDPAGKDRKAGADTVAAIEVVGGQVVHLTELDPTTDEQTTFMGTHWTTQVNHNVLGDPLKVGGGVYKRGIGVHTRSDLTYTLDGSFETLKLRVGMDDSAAPQGMADVSVVLDGKVLWESKGLKSGELKEELALPIKGGKRLELKAEPALGGGKLDVLGRVDWINVALVRP